MVKRGGSRGRGRGNASADTGAQAAGSSKKNENKSKQEKLLKKNLTDFPTEDLARKKDNLESILGTPAATVKAKVAKAKKRANMEDVRFASDNKTIDKSSGNAATKKDFCGKEQEEESSEVLTDVLKMESLVGKDSVEIKKISSKQSHSTGKPLIACASLLQAKIGEHLPVSEFLKIAKQDAINKLKKRSSDPLASKVLHQVLSLENERKVTERKSEIDVCFPMLQHSKQTDERKIAVNLKASKVKQEISSKNEKKVIEENCYEDDFVPMLQYSQDIDERKLNLDLKSSKVVQEVTERKFEVDGSPSCLHGFKLNDIIDTIQNFDLDDSNTKHIISSQHQNKMNESETEKIINLRRDVNLRFEFDKLGNKKVLVDDKDQYNPDIGQKITFDIGGGIVKLSFIDKKICIFTQGGEIDCSIRKNQVAFSLTDSTTLSESSLEGLSTSKISHNKDTEDFKDLCNKNTNGAAKKGCLHPSEEMQLESGSKNLNVSSLKPNLNLVSNSVTQQRLQSSTENFLSSVRAACHDFENEFLKRFNERN